MDKQQKLAKYGYIPSLTITKKTNKSSLILVLGAGGVVGRALVKELRIQNYRVMVVDSRQHLDLREPGAMSVFYPVAHEIF
jgi:NAD(P)-dependent dehydrogenase (short-subunit alcohol dehydrogenase family)